MATQLFLSNPRDELIFRCRAWAYENIINKHAKQAQKEFEAVVAAYDNMIQDKPTDSAGYWSGFYFNRFCQTCQARGLDRI